MSNAPAESYPMQAAADSSTGRPIFVQAMWRTGSTYVWKKFRDQPAYRAYYEPLHQVLSKTRAEANATCEPETRAALRHPPVESPYFAEYPFTDGGVEYFHKAFSYERYVLGVDEADDTLRRYLANLIAHAERQGQRPVFQFNRALLRSGWLARTFGGTQILVLRRPLHVWKSYARFAGQPFESTTGLILGQNQHKFPFAQLPRWLPFPHHVAASFDDEYGPYHEFVRAHLHKLYAPFFDFFVAAHLHAAQFADCVLDMDELTLNPSARETAAARLRALGIEINFDDCAVADYPHGKGEEEWRAYEAFSLRYLAGRLPAELRLSRTTFEAIRPSLGPYFQTIFEAFSPPLRRRGAAHGTTRAQLTQIQESFRKRPYDATVEQLGSALAAGPTAELWNAWGAAQDQCGRPHLAELGFGMALQCDPQHPAATSNLGTLLCATGRYEAALPWLESAQAATGGENRQLAGALLRQLLDHRRTHGGAPEAPATEPAAISSTPQDYQAWAQSVFQVAIPVPGVQVGTSWPAGTVWGDRAHGALVSVECEYVAQLLEEMQQKRLPGGIAEFGVHDGWWLDLLWRETERLNLDKQIWGFDSFQSDAPGQSRQEVAEKILLAERPRIKLVPGGFQETLPGPEAQQVGAICYARIDCDTYEAARVCLRYLGPRLVDGAILVFDDWPHARGVGEQRAFEEWLPQVPHLQFEFLFFGTLGHFYLRVRQRS